VLHDGAARFLLLPACLPAPAATTAMAELLNAALSPALAHTCLPCLRFFLPRVSFYAFSP